MVKSCLVCGGRLFSIFRLSVCCKIIIRRAKVVIVQFIYYVSIVALIRIGDFELCLLMSHSDAIPLEESGHRHTHQQSHDDKDCKSSSAALSREQQ